jgi:hypothetical protein
MAFMHKSFVIALFLMFSACNEDPSISNDDDWEAYRASHGGVGPSGKYHTNYYRDNNTSTSGTNDVVICYTDSGEQCKWDDCNNRLKSGWELVRLSLSDHSKVIIRVLNCGGEGGEGLIDDYCVPAGKYRYGYSKKVECNGPNWGERETFESKKLLDQYCTPAPVSGSHTEPFTGDLFWEDLPQYTNECGCSLAGLSRSGSLQSPGTCSVLLFFLLIVQALRSRRPGTRPNRPS